MCMTDMCILRCAYPSEEERLTQPTSDILRIPDDEYNFCPRSLKTDTVKDTDPCIDGHYYGVTM